MHRRILLLLALSGLASPGFAAEAAATVDGQAQVTAKVHFEKGIKLLEAEDFEGAVAEFETSIEIFPTKSGLFNLANCLKALERYAEALKRTEQLKNDFKGELDEEWQKEIANFEDSIRNTVSALFVRVDVEAAAIRIDGKESAMSPMADALLLGPGEHEVTVSKEGYETQTRPLTLVSGKKSIESFALAPSVGWLTVTANVPGAMMLLDGQSIGVSPLTKYALLPGAHTLRIDASGYQPFEQPFEVRAGETASLAPILMAAPAVPSAGAPAGDANEPPRKRRIGTAIAFAAGGAAGVGAIVTGVLHLTKTSQIKKDCDGDVCPERLSDKGDRAHRLAVATNVLISVAAVGAVTGLILFFVEGGERNDGGEVALTPVVTPSGAGLSIEGRF